ncbi:MAG: hypothetical protein V4712_12680 [Pseudomonadota bacterium]
MIRVTPFVLLALGVAACSPSVPDSGAGVGFQDYNSYIRGAQAAPPAPVVAAPVVPVTPVAPAGFNPASAAAAIDRAEGRLPVAQSLVPVATPPALGTPLDGTGTLGGQTAAPLVPAPVQGAVIGGANPTISDENDFAAVSQRETIESDKARIERNKSQYVVVQPGALPTRTGDEGPNIVQFALSTTHAPGTPVYTRRSLGRKDPAAACARFNSPDIAQEEFLRAGGPEKDKAGVDPDGDGFACAWDPRPFRTALN